MTTTYRYLFADLLTNEIIAELPLTGVSFTQQLNQAGTFQGHLLLSGINSYGYNVDASTQPARNAVYVDRDGVLVWGGIIWARTYNSSAQTLSLTAREFESYFEKRLITTTQAYTNQDQLIIARDLINNAQAAPYGDIGVIVGTETSGVLVDRVFYNYEKKGVWQAIKDLSNQDNGFDFNITVDYDPLTNVPTKTLVLGYPRTGTVYNVNDPALKTTLRTQLSQATMMKEGGEEIWTRFEPLENRVECWRCHDTKQKLRGAVQIALQPNKINSMNKENATTEMANTLGEVVAAAFRTIMLGGKGSEADTLILSAPRIPSIKKVQVYNRFGQLSFGDET